MDLSKFSSELGKCGLVFVEQPETMYFEKPSDVRLPYLMGTRDSYAMDSFMLKDANIINTSRREMTEEELKGLKVYGSKCVSEWLTERHNRVREVHKGRFDCYALGYFMVYSKRDMRFSLEIARTTEMYNKLGSLGAPDNVLKLVLSKQKFVGSDMLRLLEYLDTVSLYLPLYMDTSNPVVVNETFDKSKMVLSFGNNILNDELVMKELQINYDTVNISKRGWYYVVRDTREGHKGLFLIRKKSKEMYHVHE